MSENCTHDCSTCSSACASRTAPQDLLEKPNDMTHVKKLIGVVSGKGGVGKSLVTSMLAVLMSRQGYTAAVLDADMTGPSIPRAFGLHEQAQGTDIGIMPVVTKTGIRVMSLNLLLEHDTDPVVWRGPAIRVVSTVNTTLSTRQSSAPFSRYFCSPSLSFAPKVSAAGMPKPTQAPCTKPRMRKLRE